MLHLLLNIKIIKLIKVIHFLLSSFICYCIFCWANKKSNNIEEETHETQPIFSDNQLSNKSKLILDFLSLNKNYMKTINSFQPFTHARIN